MADELVPQDAVEADLAAVGSVQPVGASDVASSPGVQSLHLAVRMLSGGGGRPGPDQVPQPQRVLSTKPSSRNPTHRLLQDPGLSYIFCFVSCMCFFTCSLVFRPAAAYSSCQEYNSLTCTAVIHSPWLVRPSGMHSATICAIQISASPASVACLRHICFSNTQCTERIRNTVRFLVFAAFVA